MIATAIGKPKTRATAIVEVNAESKLIPRCTLSGPDMAPLHGLGGQDAVTRTERGWPLAAHSISRRDGRRVRRHG